MIIGTANPQECHIHDSKAGYHSFIDDVGLSYGSYEIFWHDGGHMVEQDPEDDMPLDDWRDPEAPGWYWWACFPGCMPESEAKGPFSSSDLAQEDADPNRNPEGLDVIYDSAVEAMLFSSTDDEDDPLEDGYGLDDLAPSTQAYLRDASRKFLLACREHLTPESYVGETHHDADNNAGNDLWYGLAGHGTGFWGGDWSEDMEKAGIAFVERYPPTEVYVGDDGKIYIFGQENFK